MIRKANLVFIALLVTSGCLESDVTTGCENMKRDLEFVQCLERFCTTITDLKKAKTCRLEARSIKSNIITNLPASKKPKNQPTTANKSTISADDFKELLK